MEIQDTPAMIYRKMVMFQTILNHHRVLCLILETLLDLFSYSCLETKLFVWTIKDMFMKIQWIVISFPSKKWPLNFRNTP
jgi:hypothetical protein